MSVCALLLLAGNQMENLLRWIVCDGFEAHGGVVVVGQAVECGELDA